ncbi:hypothetical protein D3C75_1168970 [compost metagenome]
MRDPIHKFIGAPHLAARIRCGLKQRQKPVIQLLLLNLKLRSNFLLRQLQLASQLGHSRMYDNIAVGVGQHAITRIHEG